MVYLAVNSIVAYFVMHIMHLNVTFFGQWIWLTYGTALHHDGVAFVFSSANKAYYASSAYKCKCTVQVHWAIKVWQALLYHS